MKLWSVTNKTHDNRIFRKMFEIDLCPVHPHRANQCHKNGSTAHSAIRSAFLHMGAHVLVQATCSLKPRPQIQNAAGK